MKSYSNESVSQEVALQLAAAQAAKVQENLDAVDAKQQKQLDCLTKWMRALVVTMVVNVVVLGAVITVILYNGHL